LHARKEKLKYSIKFELKYEFPQGGTTGGAKQQQGRVSRASA
jgi:hypothetical protein